MTTATTTKTADMDVPVLIVGGGGAGLTCSMLLSQLGIDHLLVSSLPTTSILPKAHVLNQRTMEILDDVGVADPIYAKSTPAENMAAMGWYAGFAGSGSGHRPTDREDRNPGATATPTSTGCRQARCAAPTCRRSVSSRS